MESHRPTLQVAAGILVHNSKVLVTQRKSDVHLAGLWEFPGGKLDADESWEQAVIRELSEELAIDVVVKDCFEQVTHAYPEKIIELKFFLVEFREDGRSNPQCIDVAGLKWCSYNELKILKFPEADFTLIEKLKHILC